MATKAFPYGDYPEQVSTPYAKAYAGQQAQPAQPQQLSAPLIGAAAQQAQYDQIAMKARELNSKGYGWNAAQEMARQMFDVDQKTQMLKDQEGLLAVQDQQQKLDEHKRMLDEQSRYQEFTQKVQSLSPTDLRRNEQLAQLSIQYPDLASSPREEIRKGFGSVMKDAHDLSQINEQTQSINAQKLGIPVDKLGGIPRDVINEQGSLDVEKAPQWSETYHKKQLDLEKASEQQRATVMLEKQDALDKARSAERAQRVLNDPLEFEKLKMEKSRTIKEGISELIETTVGSKYKDLIQSEPTAEVDAKGNKKEGGGYYKYKMPKGGPVVLKKENVIKAQQGLNKYGQMLQGVDSMVRQDLQKDIQSQTLVYDPATGKFSPK